MYKLSDYIKNGILFANNIMRPHHKRLSNLMIYSTTLCQSRCLHCSIWQKRPVEELSLEAIIKLMNSKSITKDTIVGLEGGEFMLHKQAEEIMEWFHNNHPNYTLLTNALTPEKAISAVKKYRPRHLYISLDGDKETYKYMRGVDGHDKVEQVVQACKDMVPVSLMFCLSPYNNMEDMRYVIDFANKYGIDVRIGVYGNMSFFDTTTEMLNAAEQEYLSSIPENIHTTDENYDFVALYSKWRDGKLNIRCHSIYSQVVIHPNGDVPICQNLEVVLGNIHEKSFDEIFNSKDTVKLQRHHSKECNQCWINYHRKYDIIILRNLERVLPKRLIELVYGKYNWDKTNNCKYRHIIK